MNLLPKPYIKYCENGAPLSGETDLEWADYFDLEPLDKIAELNIDIEIEKHAPGFYAFASNGSGEVFVFSESGAIYLLPLIGMAADAAIFITNSWEEFFDHVQDT